MKCPVCKNKLKHKTLCKISDDECPAIMQERLSCNTCREFEYEVVGGSQTTWLGKCEFYGVILGQEHKHYKMKIIIYLIKAKLLVHTIYKNILNIFIKKT